jgi:predicted PurR-regulated permease PerM
MFERLSSTLHEVQTNPSTVTSEVAGWLTVGALGLLRVGSSAVGLVVVPFFVFYLLLDMHHLRTLFESHLPELQGRRAAACWMRSLLSGGARFRAAF